MHFISCLLILYSCIMATPALSAEANAFNPYMHSRLPSKALRGESADMAKSLGARSSSLQEEASYRQYWQQEVYPVVFGNAKAANEILFFLDYAHAESEKMWAHIVTAAKSLSSNNNKIVLLAKNSEQYGTELMGGGIWIAYTRPQNAMQYFTLTLQQWNATKKRLAQQGISRPFTYEYDATASPTDFPILYTYLANANPPIAEKHHLAIVKYAFDAGNVNMYQAVQAAHAYNVPAFPAVVVNGRRLSKVSATSIIAAAKR